MKSNITIVVILFLITSRASCMEIPTAIQVGSYRGERTTLTIDIDEEMTVAQVKKQMKEHYTDLRDVKLKILAYSKKNTFCRIHNKELVIPYVKKAIKIEGAELWVHLYFKIHKQKAAH